MGLKKWDTIRNKVTDSMINDVRDLRNDEFKSQMNQEKQKADNQQLWDSYKRKGNKIDVPEFDAQITDLPEEDENEKEIKITPTIPKGTSTILPQPSSEEWDLENLAGNGLSKPEPKEPRGVSTDLPRESNEEWDMEDLAGNGQRESLENMTDDTLVEEPTFEELEIEPGEVEEPDVIPEPDEDIEENSVSDEEVENTPAPEEEEEKPEPKEEEPTKEVEDTKAPKESGSTETEKAEEEKPAPKEEKPTKEKPKKETTKEKTKTTDAPINDDSDLVKRGSGVSINDIVDRSAIPHYDYLSFFR